MEGKDGGKSGEIRLKLDKGKLSERKEPELSYRNGESQERTLALPPASNLFGNLPRGNSVQESSNGSGLDNQLSRFYSTTRQSGFHPHLVLLFYLAN